MTNAEKLQELFKKSFSFLPPDDVWDEIFSNCPAPEGVCTMMVKKYGDKDICSHCPFHDFWKDEYKVV